VELPIPVSHVPSGDTGAYALCPDQRGLQDPGGRPVSHGRGDRRHLVGCINYTDMAEDIDVIW